MMHPHRISLLLPLLAAGLCAGCADSSNPDGGPAPSQQTFTAPDCDPSELCLQEPERGFQIRSVGTLIEPGQDVEYCEVVQLPGTADDKFYVKAFESQMTSGSHHLIVSAIIPGTKTDENAPVGERVPCVGTDVFGGELQPVTGAQLPYAVDTFPEGVGRVYQGGQKIVFDYHYFNSTGAPIEARSALNFHTVDASEIDRFARGFGFYNIGISVPPGATESFTTECSFDHDIMVHKLTRHTHQWGTDFSVWHAGGDKDGEHVFTSHDYEEIEHNFEEPILVRAGEGFRFMCEYTNTTDYTLEFGLKASDEMCILFGSWYVVNEGDQVGQQGCFQF